MYIKFKLSKFYRFLTTWCLILGIIKEGNGEVYTSYQTEIRCESKYSIEYPATISEVQNIIHRAIRLQTRVKAFGSRHSVLDTICTDGIPIDMHKINYVVIDQAASSVAVGAGAELGDFCSELERNGRALSGHVPSYGGVTIAGAMGTGARGSSLLHPTSLSDQIISLTFVDGTGQVQVINDSSPDFNAFRVHLGLLGIIVEVTFKTVPAYKMKIENYKTSDSILFDGTAVRMARTFDWFEFHWFPSSRSVIVSKGNFVSLDTPGNATTNKIPDVNRFATTAIRTIFEKGQALRVGELGLYGIQAYVQRSLYRRVPLRPPIFTEDGVNVQNPAVGYVHNLMQNRCKQCGWSYGPSASVYAHGSAFGVSIENFTPMIKTVQSILAQNPVPFPIYGIFFRFGPASNSLMALEHGRDTVHIEILTPRRTDPFNTARIGLGPIQEIEQAMMFDLQGRPHFSLNGYAFHTIEMIKLNSPKIMEFRNAILKFDPHGTFMNKFGERVLGLSDAYPKDSRVTHCALQDDCFCKRDFDCANGQVCKKFRKYNVCQDRTLQYVPITTVVNQGARSLRTFLDSIRPPLISRQ